MTLDRRALFGLALLASGASLPTEARPFSNPHSIALWPNGLPEAIPTGLREVFVERSTSPAIQDRKVSGIIEPRLEADWPTNPNGASIIIMPGGGYR